jgi:hypothetical protein
VLGAQSTFTALKQSSSDHSADVQVDRRAILKWILCNGGVRLWTLHATGSLLGPTGSCEHGNKPSGFKKEGKFFCHLGDYEVLKKDSASWSSLKAEPRRHDILMTLVVRMKHNSLTHDLLRFTCSCNDEAIWAEIKQANRLKVKV